MDHKINDIYSLFLEHPSVSTDSRKIQPGSLFFALRGESFNGNEFAATALEAGASFAIVDDPRFVLNKSCVLVDDVLAALQGLSHHHRLQFNIPVIAITGTNGKTTTKELISAVLSTKYKTLATSGNLNNHIGVPLTLLRLTGDTEIAVIEMGANHPGEIDFLCQIAQPDYGLITNIGKAHLEGFGGVEGVIRTKTEMYRFLLKNNGIIFLNQDDLVLKKNAVGIKTITYGYAPADLFATDIDFSSLVNMTLHFRDHQELRIESKLFGRYNAGNILAAACIGQHFSVPPADIQAAIEEFQPGNNRSQILRTNHNLLILDAYNANPTSMKGALESFAASEYPDKKVILGDMLELGRDTDVEHLEILKLVDSLAFKQVCLVGPVFTRLNSTREYLCFQDSELACMWFEHDRIENSTLLLKGSRGIKLERLIEFL